MELGNVVVGSERHVACLLLFYYSSCDKLLWRWQSRGLDLYGQVVDL